MSWTQVATADELKPGDRKSVFIDDEPVLLVRVDDAYYAIDDVCTHDGQPLTDGPVEGTEITCPRHGARFDLATGAAMCMPATEGVRTYDVETRDGQVLARPAETEAGAEASGAEPVAGAETETETETEAGLTADEPAEAVAAAEDGDEPVTNGTAALALLEALRDVIDPELMINIVDLGLVYDVRQDDTQVNVDMTLTSPACPAGPQIFQQAKMALERLDGVEAAEITLVMTPPWTPDRMTDQARDQLNIF